MSKIKFRFINEWKAGKNELVKTFTPFQLNIIYCSCGCHEVSFLFVAMSFGFFITINPTPVNPRVGVENPEFDQQDEKSA